MSCFPLSFSFPPDIDKKLIDLTIFRIEKCFAKNWLNLKLMFLFEDDGRIEIKKADWFILEYLHVDK